MALIQKAFSDIITFSRSSNATRVGPTGVLEYAPHNLVTYSEQFDNAAWTKVNSTITANAIAAPNGTVTADKLVENTATDARAIAETISVTAGVTYTISVYLKKGERQYSALWFGTLSSGAVVDLNAGTITAIPGFNNPNSATITNVGNGWYRASVTYTSPSTTSATITIYLLNDADFANRAYTGDGTSGLYLWGAQLAVGPYALDYTPTTSAAVYGPRFDYDGSGVTIVEPVSRNLVLYSEQFNDAAWNKDQATVTSNTTTAPDGTLTADTLTENTAPLEHFTSQQTSKAATNIPYTFSVYVKRATSGTRNVVVALTDGTSGGYEAVFDPDDGAILIASRGIGVTTGWTPGAATATNAGNGWWRFTFSAVSNTSTRIDGVVYLADGTTKTYTGDGSSNLFVWGAQLEVGSTATAYMVSGASNGFRAVPVVSGSATPKGLLVEEQRQNLALYSENFSNAAWTKTRSSITANAVAAPDGTVTADKLVEDTTASSTHYIVQSISLGGSVDSSPYVFSIFAKAGERTRMQMFDNNSNTSGATVFNLSSGTVVSGPGTITPAGNGWYRCSIYPLKDFTTSSTVYIQLDNGSTVTYTGNGTSGLYLWGAQLEAPTSFSTSYIPTLASAVTRSADVASVNTLSPWYSSTGTIYTEIERYASSQNVRGSIFHDGTTSNFIGSSEYTFGGQGGVVVDSGVAQVSLGAGSSSLGVKKLAFAFGTNDFALSENGGAVTTDTSGTVPTVTTLGIGSLTSANVGTGYIRRIAFYPRRLTNAELQALSA